MLEASAGRSGIRSTEWPGGRSSFTPAAALDPDYLGKPSCDAIVVEPLTALRRGELRLVGETREGGRRVLELVPRDPDRLDTHWFVAADGTLLRRHQSKRWGLGSGGEANPETVPLRTVVTQIARYERLPGTASKRAAGGKRTAAERDRQRRR